MYNNNNTKPKLPVIKKWTEPVYEQLRCDMLEVLSSSGAPYEYYEVKENDATNPWVKVYNDL